MNTVDSIVERGIKYTIEPPVDTGQHTISSLAELAAFAALGPIPDIRMFGALRRNLDLTIGIHVINGQTDQIIPDLNRILPSITTTGLVHIFSSNEDQMSIKH